MKELKLNKKYIISIILCLLLVPIIIISFNHNNEPEAVLFEFTEGLSITEISSYKGKYYEDGTNENVSDILMIKVINTTNQDLQYTEITLRGEKKNAYFSLSTLPAGESIYVLESQRLTYDQENYFHAFASNTVFFNEEPTMYKGKIKIQTLDGAFNVTNKSNEDINGVIYIYYKNIVDDQLFGGITYRAKVEGLKSGELKQVMTNHYTKDGSQIMFVTIGDQ